MKQVVWIMVVCMGITVSGVAQDAREISRKSTEAIDVGAMKMDATLKIIDAKGRERIRRLTTTTGTFNEVTKTILKFNAPADVKGTTLLIYDYDDKDDDMWIYLPALRKNRRIVSSDRGSSFMGSEFTNADMTIPNPDDFIYTLLGEEDLNSKDCWKVEAKCKDEDVEDAQGYSRTISWIEKQSYLCHKVEYYNFDNELYKVQSIGDYRKISGETFFAYVMEMKNVRNGRTSVMIVDSFSSNSKLKEEDFSPSMLSR